MPKVALSPKMSLVEIQDYIFQACEERGFDKESIQDSFMLLTEEIGELAKSLRKMHGVKLANDAKKLSIEDEVADIFWMLSCICNRLDIDLSAALQKKEVKNQKRTWS